MMNDFGYLKHCLQTLNTGIAVADPETWSIVFENAKFFQWFAPSGDEEDLLEKRLTELDTVSNRGGPSPMKPRCGPGRVR